MLKYLENFERLIIYVLLALMAIVVLFATVELAWLLAKDLFSPPWLMLETRQLLDIFGLFLLVLIGIELLHSVKTYITEHQIHVENALTVAMIAVARKIIILEPKGSAEGALLGIAALVVGLGIGYYLIRRSQHVNRPGF